MDVRLSKRLGGLAWLGQDQCGDVQANELHSPTPSPRLLLQRTSSLLIVNCNTRAFCAAPPSRLQIGLAGYLFYIAVTRSPRIPPWFGSQNDSLPNSRTISRPLRTQEGSSVRPSSAPLPGQLVGGSQLENLAHHGGSPRPEDFQGFQSGLRGR